MVLGNAQRLSVVSLVLLTLGTAASALAHDGRPVYLEIGQIDHAAYQVRLQIPASIPWNTPIRLRLPSDCKPTEGLAQLETVDGTSRSTIYRCTEPLEGRNIGVDLAAIPVPTSTLIRYRDLSAVWHSEVMPPGGAIWRVPHPQSTGRVAREYLRFGVTHILNGADHLLFLLCLLWIARRRIIITVSGFTLGHSATLLLSAIDVLRTPVEPVEATIALSIVFMAAEVVKGPTDNFTWRFPFASASAFGLLHGLGFATALVDIGLPEREMGTALMFFNIGVELGQLFFVSFALVFAKLLMLAHEHQLRGNLDVRRARVMCGYLVGTMGVHWLAQRVSFSL